MTLHSALQKHDDLVKYLDKWMRSVQKLYADQMQCKSGCAQCCRGLFDLSLPDAMRVAQAFNALPQDIKSTVKKASSEIEKKIALEGKELKPPFFLNNLSQDRIDQLAESGYDVNCPLLDNNDCCLIYKHRPIACRLEGIPMVDLHDGVFGDWCELNFKEGVPSERVDGLRMDYYELQRVEQEATAYLSSFLLASREEEVTVFLPSVIASFDTFWAKWI
jgi:Fe-S-cluster containining protein